MEIKTDIYYDNRRKEQEKKNISTINEDINVRIFKRRRRRGYEETEISSLCKGIRRKELERKNFVEKNLAKLYLLEDRTLRIMKYRYGLDDGRIKTLAEVGNDMGLTRERVRQIIKRGMDKLAL